MTNIKTKKRFGKHFLINEVLALNITKKLYSRHNLLDIGPVKGVLTKYLFEEKNSKLVVS